MAERRPAKREFVVDTNVLAYYTLGTTPFCEEISELLSKPVELIAPDSWRAELLNVVWQAARAGAIQVGHGLELLEEVEKLLDRSVPVRSIWREALVCAQEHDISTHDTLFIVLAEREQLDLLTYDRRLLAAFPHTARSPGRMLSE